MLKRLPLTERETTRFQRNTVPKGTAFWRLRPLELLETHVPKERTWPPHCPTPSAHDNERSRGLPAPSFALSTTSPCPQGTPHPRVASRGGMKGSLPSGPARPLPRFPWASPWTAAALGKAASPAPASSPSQHSVCPLGLLYPSNFSWLALRVLAFIISSSGTLP